MPGTFISFEGPDGAGKTSVLRAIVARLQPELGDRLLLTREPGGTDNKIAEAIRDLVLDPANTEMDQRKRCFTQPHVDNTWYKRFCQL